MLGKWSRELGMASEPKWSYAWAWEFLSADCRKVFRAEAMDR